MTTSWIRDRGEPILPPWDGYRNYDVGFNFGIIVTTVTREPERVTEWISEVEQYFMSGSSIVGLDVEWRPSSGQDPPKPVCVLVLCVDLRCLIYQIIHSIFVPQSLVNYLSNRSYTFAGVGIKAKLEKLNNDYVIGGSVNFIDLGTKASTLYCRLDLKDLLLKELARFVLGVEIQAPLYDVSSWDNWGLSNEQVRYATVNAKASYDICKILLS